MVSKVPLSSWTLLLLLMGITTFSFAERSSGRRIAEIDAPVWAPAQHTKEPKDTSPVWAPTVKVHKSDKTSSPSQRPDQGVDAPIFSPTNDKTVAPMQNPVTQPPITPAPKDTMTPLSIMPAEIQVNWTISPITPSPITFANDTTSSPVTTAPITTMNDTTSSPNTPSPISTTNNTTSSPVTTTPISSVNSTTSKPVTPEPRSQSPSLSPIPINNIPAVVFINEAGIFNGSNFIEIAYSSFLKDLIQNYSYHLYDSKGKVLASTNFKVGNTKSYNGMSFTYSNLPTTQEDMEGVALVDETSQAVLNFLTNGRTVKAMDGPAKDLTSIDISTLQSRSRKEENSGNSMGLIGTGCNFTSFSFASMPASPGRINQNQKIDGCDKEPISNSSATEGASDPTSVTPQSSIGDKDVISTGAIVAISISTAFLALVVIHIFRGTSKM